MTPELARPIVRSASLASLMLDDAVERAVGAQHQAAIAAGVRRPHAEHDDRRVVRRLATLEHAPQRRGRARTACRHRPPGCRRVKSFSASRALPTAWPVPSCSAWKATPWGATSFSTTSMPGAITATIRARPSGARQSSTWPIRVRPPIRCITFGRLDFMRVPLPAARTMAAALSSGMVGYGLLRLDGGPSGRRGARLIARRSRKMPYPLGKSKLSSDLRKPRGINMLKTAEL